MNSKAIRALERTKAAPPQTQVEIMRGLTVRRTKGGIPVIRHHYSADPVRDPDLNPAWKATERKAYTSQAAWDREQEIRDEAGGGELVFADTLVTYWSKIVITDPGGSRTETGASKEASTTARPIPRYLSAATSITTAWAISVASTTCPASKWPNTPRG